jgi:predicted ATP-grasp superfamily ATP-dependent carboligase
VDLAGYLECLPFERAVLIASGDSWTRRVAQLDPQLSTRFPSSVPSAAVLARLMDKSALADSLRTVGIPHPSTRMVSSASELDGMPDRAFESAFLKPADSEAFLGRYSIKAFNIRSRETAVQRMEDLKGTGIPMLIQEYIPGPPSNHYFIDGYIDRAGRTVARFARRRLRMFPADFGNSTYMKSVPISEVAAAAESLDRLLGHVDYRGVFSAEFKRDDRDGQFKLLEVNVRPWWYVEFAARCGVDVCDLSYRDALGHNAGPVTEYKEGARLVYPYNDYFSYRALHRRGELSLSSWLRSWMGATQPVFCWDDPMPAVIELSQFLVSRFRARRPYRGPERRRFPRDA